LDAFNLDSLIGRFDIKEKSKIRPTPRTSDEYQFITNEINGLNTSEPVWFSGGFGHPDYYTDVEYW
jgi:hypothetical protein